MRKGRIAGLIAAAGGSFVPLRLGGGLEIKVIGQLLSLQAVVLAQDPPPGGGAGAGSMLPLFVMIGIAFYLMILRPETKRKSDMDRMHKELKKNDRVVTIGGIHGTIVNASPDAEDVTIKVDEGSNAKLRINRTAVQNRVEQR